MATLDLGKIKQVWRGTYNNSTAYVVDDLVEYTDNNITSTYICVANSTGNAPSTGGTAHASWNYIAKGVVDPVPSQSGNSGKFLTTNGSAASWATLTGNTPAAYLNLTSDTGNLNSYTWYTLGGSYIPCAEVFDTDNAVSSGVFTVPSGGAGTYMFHIFTTHTGSSAHSGSDGTFHRIQKQAGGTGSYAVTPSNAVYKTIYITDPGHEIAGAFSSHVAYNLSVGDKIRAQVWSYRSQGASNLVWRAGDTDSSFDGSSGGTYVIMYRMF